MYGSLSNCLYGLNMEIAAENAHLMDNLSAIVFIVLLAWGHIQNAPITWKPIQIFRSNIIINLDELCLSIPICPRVGPSLFFNQSQHSLLPNANRHITLFYLSLVLAIYTPVLLLNLQQNQGLTQPRLRSAIRNSATKLQLLSVLLNSLLTRLSRDHPVLAVKALLMSLRFIPDLVTIVRVRASRMFPFFNALWSCLTKYFSGRCTHVIMVWSSFPNAPHFSRLSDLENSGP